MAIYPDKKHGKHTGRWRVEVQYQGRRLRGRFDTLEEAKREEAQFLERLKAGEGLVKEDKRPRAHFQPRTLLEALAMAQDALWKGKAIYPQAVAHVKLMDSLLGSGRPLRSLRTEDIDALIEKLSEGRKDSTVNRHLSSLHRLLKWCAQRHYIDEVPIFEWKDEDEGRIRWLTMEEEERLITLMRSYGQDLIADFIAVALDTGCRRGELLDMDPRQVDQGWLRLWKTKTKTPRSVPLTPRAQEILDTRRDKGLFNGLAKHTLRYFWDKAKADMGLQDDEHFVVHALRHTCASRLVWLKVDLVTVKKFLGHKRIETTIRYTHVSDASLAEASSLLAGHSFRETLSAPLGGGRIGGGFVLPQAALGHIPTLEIRRKPGAGVAELVDAPDLGSGDETSWGFKSLRPHHGSGSARPVDPGSFRQAFRRIGVPCR